MEPAFPSVLPINTQINNLKGRDEEPGFTAYQPLVPLMNL